jgi:hypothetical protein
LRLPAWWDPFRGVPAAGTLLRQRHQPDALDAGYEIELAARNIQDRLPRGNLICDDSFVFSRFPTRFDFALAQSVFIHLPRTHLQACLACLASSMAPGGILFATVFIATDDQSVYAPYL